MSVRPSVEKKVFFPISTKFGVQIVVDEWYTTVCRMTRSKVKAKVTEVWNLRKWPISKSSCSDGMHVIKRLTGNSDNPNPRQYPNFQWTDFWYSSSFGVTWLSNLGCSTFSKRIVPLTRIRPAVQYGAYFFIRDFDQYWNCVDSCLSFSLLILVCQWSDGVSDPAGFPGES